MDRNDIRALTFDCYGTLIDWLTGVREGLAQVPSLVGCDLEQLVRDRDELDVHVVTQGYAPYSELLAESVRRAAERQGRHPLPSELERFAEGMGDWPAFEDSRAALARLGTRYRLAILSNVEDRILARSVQQLGAHFETLVTAEQVCAYKPSHAHFHEALSRLGLDASQVVHVACSPWHDLKPAGELGWSTMWVRRDAAILPGHMRPDWTVNNLSEAARTLGV